MVVMVVVVVVEGGVGGGGVDDFKVKPDKKCVLATCD